MVMPDIGRIIRILSPTTVLINLGRNNSVSVGDIFLVFIEGEEIIDPETGKKLGKYEYSKGTLVVTNVQQQFSEAQDVRREAFSPVSETIASLKTGVTTTKKLSVDEREIAPLRTLDSELLNTIRVGDKVRFLR